MKHLPDAMNLLLRGVTEVEYVAPKGNAGDAVIGWATAQAIGERGVTVTPGAPVTLVAGSGNLIPRYNCLERAIHQMPRDRRIIILPSTVVGCYPLLQQFPNLMLLARDEVTFRLAQAAGVQVMPCHDAALSLDYSKWAGPGEGVLRAFRSDDESAGRMLPVDNRDVSLECRVGRWTLDRCEADARKFIATISGYAEIETDRLHVAIVAAKLGKRVTLWPGSYHKNRSVWAASLEAMGVKWALPSDSH